MLARSGNRLIGAVPLMISTDKTYAIPARKISFIGDHTWTIGDFIISGQNRDVINALMKCLLQIKCDIIEFHGIPEDSDNLEIIKTFLDENELKYRLAPGATYPFISINMSWEDFYNARSVRFKKAIRNKLNRIKKTGQYSIRRYTAPKEIRENIQIVFDIGLKGWKHSANKAISSTKESSAFYASIAEEMANNGQLIVWVLEFNDIPIAFEYHLSHNSRIHALVSDFDESYRELSPGSILDYHIVEHLFKSEICEYDLGSGNSFYKEHWTESVKNTMKLSFYKQDMYSKMLLFIESRIVPAARFMRDKFKRVNKSA